MICVEDVHKTYRQGGASVAALRGVTFRIDDPGFYAVMGRSGSGKSTLLHLLAGLDRPDRGSVQIDGEDLARMNERGLTQLRRGRVGIVFQTFNLITTLTARQNIALPGVIDGRPRSWIDQRVDQLLDELELMHRAGHRPDAMSGGEQQRVAIARALLFDPRVLLADEPTGNLDSASSLRLWRLLADLAARQKRTILMVTHEAAAAANTRRVFVLGDGQCQSSFDVDGLDASAISSRCQQSGR